MICVVSHLMKHVLPAAADYEAAEAELSSAFAADNGEAAWKLQGEAALRHAANLAVAIDGLTDRAEKPMERTKPAIRREIELLCTARPGSHDRVRGVAVAYKHQTVADSTIPVKSEDDILTVAVAYGMDAYGVGKFGGPEVVVRDREGTKWKFLGDIPVAVRAWFFFLDREGAPLPRGAVNICGMQVHI